MKKFDMSQLINQGTTLEKIVECNLYTKGFGLVLSREDAKVLMMDRTNSLRQQGRIEFGVGILPKLIFTFCDSGYIYQDNYVDVIGRLQDIFYLYKNEALDEWTDDELLEVMKKQFEEEARGDLDFLEDTCLEAYARKMRELVEIPLEEKEN
ncbi:MAG: DUF6323 family protein [Anaerostipes sp.]|nr:DUF6323 family protein [Anaerostipes sp.]